MKNGQKIMTAAAAVGLLLLSVFSAEAKAAAAEALQLCGATLLPSLFPFYVTVKLLLSADTLQSNRYFDRMMRFLFGLPGEAAPALLLGLLGGYPIGAATAAELYRQGTLTKQEAAQISCFCNNAGPAFIIGAAGLAVFDSVKTGLLLYGVHVLSAPLTGILLRQNTASYLRTRRIVPVKKTDLSNALSGAISAAVNSMLMICAYVVFCSVLLAVIKALPPVQSFLSCVSRVLPTAEALFSGMAELTCGTVLLYGCPWEAAFVTASVLLGWGGFCVYLQGSTVLSEAGLPCKQLLTGKSLQALIAGSLACLICCVRTKSLYFMLLAAVFLAFILLLAKLWGRKIARSLL